MALTIRLLSYNIFCRPPFITDAGPTGNDYKEFFRLGSFRQSRFIAAAQKLGFLNHARASFAWQHGFVADAGLLILSKLSILETSSLTYPRGSFHTADFWVSKGLLYVLLETPEGGRLNLATTHLQAWDFPKVREKQLKAAWSFVSEVLGRNPYPFLFAGDFNVPGAGEGGQVDSQEYLNMMTMMWHPRDVLKEKFGVHPPTEGRIRRDRPSPAHPPSIDYILFYDPRDASHGARPAMEGASVEPFSVETGPFVQCSDHFAVACAFDCDE